MNSYHVRIWDKYKPEAVAEGSVDAQNSKRAVELLEGGPVKQFRIPFEGEPRIYIGKQYVYEVSE